MTEQVIDSLEYEGQNYSIIDTDGDDLYNLILLQHGLKPVSWCTDCWSGYLCKYKIKDQKLYLHTLEICLTEPRLGGIKQVKKVYAPSINGCTPIDISNNKNFSFEYLYNDINLPICFDGNLLIGNNITYLSIYEMCELDIKHPMYQYRNLHELVFRSGILAERNDIFLEVADRWIKLRDRRSAEFRQQISSEAVYGSEWL